MKKVAAFIIALVMIFALGATALATSRVVTAELHYKDIKIVLDGKELVPVDIDGNSAEPFIIGGTTYLPVRGIASALGLDVQWDATTNTVILKQPESKRAIYITRTGKKYHYDDSCNGGTYWEVPLSTALGFDLEPCDKCVK